MANQTTFTRVSDGDILSQGYFNGIYNRFPFFTDSSPVFGGDGSTGSIDLSAGSVGLVRGQIYNYAYINLSGTAYIYATADPDGGNREDPIIIRCSGNCTITTSAVAINLSGAGVTGGAADAAGSSIVPSVRGGQPGGGGAGGGGGGAGAGGHGADGEGAGGAPGRCGLTFSRWAGLCTPGAGGGGGYTGGGAGDPGGNGGGAIYMEVGGNFVFSSGSINVRGNGGTNTGTSTHGGGGGGGGGTVLVLYAGSYTSGGAFLIEGGAGTAGSPSGVAGGSGGIGMYTVLKVAR